MTLDISEKNGIIIAALQGQIRISTQNIFMDQMNQVFDAYGKRTVILNMESVSYINSAGIGILVDTFKRFRDNDASFILCGLSPDILKLFEVTKLSRFIEIYPNVEEAMKKLMV